MFKNRGKRPIKKVGTYLKYGFVITEHESFLCPGCGNCLNAGPGYQPEFCNRCGQHINFDGIGWKKDKVLGFEQETQRSEDYAPVKN